MLFCLVIVCCSDIAAQVSAAELKVRQARLYRKLRVCDGTKQATGLKSEYDPPAGQLFLRVEGTFELAEGEQIRGSKDIVLTSDGSEYKPLTNLKMANAPWSYTHLGFELKSSQGFDLLFLVPESCGGGTLSMAQWNAMVTAEAARDDKPPSIHEDVRITIKGARYIESIPSWESTLSHPEKVTVTLESIPGRMMAIDVLCEPLKKRRMYSGQDAEIVGSDFSITLPSLETISGHGLISKHARPGSKLVVDREAVEYGKPEEVKLLFLVPPGIDWYYLSFRGEPIGRARVGQ
jgi:hypothetical protein